MSGPNKDPSSKLITQLAKSYATKQTEGNFSYYELENPPPFLQWATVNGYIFHGTIRKISEALEPKPANDLIKESGNRVAVYMTNNPRLAMFTALTGGKDVGGRRNVCHMKITGDKVTYPGKQIFQVGNPEAIASEGFIYIFDRKTQSDEEIGGELLSYKPIKPLAIIKIHRSHFPHPIHDLKN